jgi:hypothetical protein
MFVGGEFYDDQRWVTNSPTLSTTGTYFLNGGRACLTVIADYLHARKIDRVLLPAYLCPSILDVLDQCGIQYNFYQINEDLSIDLEDFFRKADGFRAVYFINYFGFLHPEIVLTRFRELQSEGVIVIEDNAQAGFHSHPTGDFIFNSLRKFTACDGGYLIAKDNLETFLDKYHGRLNRRLPLIREYRSRLPAYLFNGRVRRSELERLFYQAETYYEEDRVVLGDPMEKEKIEKQDWQAIKSVRRRNYAYLLNLISPLHEVTPIYPTLQAENMPLGLPVYISGGLRDQVNESLADASVSLSIHWDALIEDPRTNTDPLVVKLAGSILTLAIDQYTSLEQLDYQVLTLANILEVKSKSN